MPTSNCIHCGVLLTPGENWTSHRQVKNDYVCVTCYNEYIQKSNSELMYVNGKYVSKKNPLHKPGRYKTLDDAWSHAEIDSRSPEGEVYAITNLAFPGWVKIGMAVSAEDRLRGYQTGDPHRGYKLLHAVPVKDRAAGEKRAHEILERLATRREGEWFLVSAVIAMTTLWTVKELDDANTDSGHRS